MKFEMYKGTEILEKQGFQVFESGEIYSIASTTETVLEHVGTHVKNQDKY